MSTPNEIGWPFEELPQEDGLDIDAIFGGTSTSANSENPFETPQEQRPASSPAMPAPEAIPETESASPAASAPQTAKQENTPVHPKQNETADTENLLQAAFAQKTVENTQKGLFEKLPIFSYGGAKEDIADTSMTFEELRIQKADDFPELEDGKTVSWQVKYGDIRKSITDPKGTTVAKMKEEIEMSKPFLDSLKKGKVKHPECLVTPSVTAKSKGLAPYKGVFPSVEAARASDKVISLIPARDGRVYEMRRTELGEFIAPKHNVVDFAEVRAGFVPALPLIPKELTGQIISFFRCFMHGEEEYEALAYIYWDRQEEEFVVFVPKQKASKSHVDTTLPGNSLPEDRYLHYADIHSHNSMAAKFSDIDDQDEKATRLYIVLGHLDRFYPAISVRISCGGSFVELDPETVLEGLGENFPTAWLERVETMDTVKSPTSKRGSFQRMLENLAHLEAEA